MSKLNLGDLASKLAKSIIFPIMSIFDKKEDDLKVFKDPYGMSILYRNKSLDKLVLLEQYKWGEYCNVDVKNGDTVIDIGGHIGTSTISYSRLVGSDGYIHSIEADPTNYGILSKNVKRNNLKNVSLYEMAIVGNNKVGEVEIIIDKNNTAGHSLYSSNIDTSNKVTVPAMTLEVFCRENKVTKIDILHMDIEGAEFEILLNIDKAFLTKIPKIIFEYHDLFDTGHNHEELVSLLNELGYKTEIEIPFLPKLLKLGTGIVYAHK